MAGIAAGAGSLIGGLLSKQGASAANEHNREIAQNQMLFQHYESSTAYQRAVQDLQKAGLNPALAYQQGGASTPQGAAIPMQNEWEGASQHIANSARAYAEIRNLYEQNNNLKAQSDNQSAQAALYRSQIPIAAAQVDQMAASSAMARAQVIKVNHEVGEVLARTRHYENDAERIKVATEMLNAKKHLALPEALLAMELVEAQIYQSSETGRHQGRLADQPIVGGGVPGSFVNAFLGTSEVTAEALHDMMGLGRFNYDKDGDILIPSRFKSRSEAMGAYKRDKALVRRRQK